MKNIAINKNLVKNISIVVLSILALVLGVLLIFSEYAYAATSNSVETEYYEVVRVVYVDNCQHVLFETETESVNCETTENDSADETSSPSVDASEDEVTDEVIDSEH